MTIALTLGKICRPFHTPLLLCTSNIKQIPFLMTFATGVKQFPKKRMVYRSSSNNIFANLALEEWIYERTDLSETDVLLVWQSNPCVVIGKHQNPWMEANIPALEKDGVHLARRSSGGGTVYHDNGNLNLSFLTDRSRYNRTQNLELVVNAVRAKWELDLAINDRDDIILDGMHKISGTAAKLTRNKSYHHFTLLHSVDQSRLSACLASPFRSQKDTHAKSKGALIHSRSTKSVPAPVENLHSRAPSMTLDLLVDAIVNKFLERESTMPEAVTFVNPLDESLFPGVPKICDRLKSWDWIYGKTPKFSLTLDTPDTSHVGKTFVRSISIACEKGCLASFTLIFNDDKSVNLAGLLNLEGLQMNRGNITSSLTLLEQDGSLFKEFSNALPDFVDAKLTLENIHHCVTQFVLCHIS